jgi:hypothetical protein
VCCGTKFETECGACTSTDLKIVGLQGYSLTLQKLFRSRKVEVIVPGLRPFDLE